MKIVRNILSLAAIATMAVAVSAPSFAGDGPPGSTPGFLETGVHTCDPGLAKMLSGTWDMSTRTAPFAMTINIDANCNVWGAYSRVPYFTAGGNISGRMISDVLIISLRQSNGLGGMGSMKMGYDSRGYTLSGPVSQDGDTYPLSGWTGSKKAALAAGANPTALNDVDVYAGPGGKYKITGMMRKGAAAPKLGSNADGWCKLQGVANGLDGWVAADHLSGC